MDNILRKWKNFSKKNYICLKISINTAVCPLRNYQIYQIYQMNMDTHTFPLRKMNTEF